MTTFVLFKDGEEIERETVECTCKTVEDYVNRRFGSVDPEAYGIMIKIDMAEEPAAEEAAAPKEPVVAAATKADA